MINIKSPSEINKIKLAAALWKQAASLAESLIQPGKCGLDIAAAVRQLVTQANGSLVFKNYQGFPGDLCVSVNEVCIHGVPNNKPFQIGDKVNVDIGIGLNGAVCDSGFSKIVGADVHNYQPILDHTYQALWAGINAAVCGNYVGDIATAISNYVKNSCPQYAILQNYTGHGCGLSLHEDPIIPNYGMKPKSGAKLVAGMVICIEPILTTAAGGVSWVDPHDQWSVCVAQNAQSCHFEHMVLIEADQTTVLTAREFESHHQFIKRNINERE